MTTQIGLMLKLHFNLTIPVRIYDMYRNKLNFVCTYILSTQTDICIEVQSVSAKRKEWQRNKGKRYKTRLHGSQKIKQLRL